MSGPCAACKFLRRKCATGCIFAPYFPPDQPTRFSNVHKVFGASNVAKLLNELLPPLREDAVNSLAYEAEMRLKNPVYGCVAYISLLQLKIKQVEVDLSFAKKELASYLGSYGPSQSLPPPDPSSASHVGIGTALGLGSSSATSSSHVEVLLREQQRLAEAQRLATSMELSRESEMFRFDRALDKIRIGYDGHLMNSATVALPLPSNQVLPHHQAFQSVFLTQQPSETELQLQMQMQVYMAQQQHKRVESDEGRNCVGPSMP